MRYKDVIDAIGNTPLVEMPRLSPKPGVRLYAKLEGNNPAGSIKDRIAKYMILRAESTGELTPGKTILEGTSGNTGIALAMIGRRRGYKVKAVMPENVSVERRQLLQLFGADIVLTDAARGTNGAIEVANEMGRDPQYYVPFQFGNPANPQAHYETTAPEIIADLPEIDVFVAGLGTGGTITGTGHRLKEHNPQIKVIAAEPNAGDQIQGLRSLEEGFTPPVLDPDVIDRKFLVSGHDAILGTRLLTEREGLFAGISSGAALYAALRVAKEMERGNIVVILADGGWKYLSVSPWTCDPGMIEREGVQWW
ncbi:MAG: cysteine synthase family protein [Chloroflexi bacterium]|nr:cysteine synthase family protein [Chloroflexota bacterium]